MAEKMRVHILAKELNVPSKTIVEKCRAEGIESVKNHMSTLSAGLHATIREWFSEGSTESALETSAPVDLEKVRIKKKTRAAKRQAVEEGGAEDGGGATTAVAQPAGASAAAAEAPTQKDMQAASERRDRIRAERGTTGQAAATAASVAELPAVQHETAQGQMAPQAGEEAAPTPAAEAPAQPAAAEVTPPAVDESATEVESPPPEPVRPVGPQHVPAPAKLQGPRVVRYEAPDYDARPPRRSLGEARPTTGTDDTGTGKELAVPTDADPTSSAEARRHASGAPGALRRRGRANPRRAAGRLAEAGERLAEWRDRDLVERRERLAGATGRRMVRRRTQQAAGPRGAQAEAAPKTSAVVHEPVRMKEFCSVTGLSFIQLFKVLKDEHGIVANINMTLPAETAELLALHFGIELTVVPARTLLDDLEEEYRQRARDHKEPRPPVVTMLGHVDHGKTTLLDVIRKAQVAEGEDGGITQHIGAYRVSTPLGDVTFLDTPGHAAFTAMRARGAHMTDVAVLVVAADDGVMPQTVEAINHARAAEVPIVVALNKIDVGDQNKLKIYGQLAEHGLTPAGDWGGDVDVIPTSAITGTGTRELLEHLAALASVLELRADPTLPAAGTIIEVETKTGVGPVARILVSEGTLHVGDIVVCGNAAGKVRALLNDRGERIEAAGPSTPVEVWGLDDVPTAGDKLYQVENAQRAKEIAAETKHGRVASARLLTRKAGSLQEMLRLRDAEGIPELNLIIKADVDGSVDALRHSLAEFPSDDVKLTIRHGGVGAVTDSDVLLASTCHGIIVAFRVDVSLGAKRLAESHGVDIRSYRVIYDVRDDIKKALEGLLAPAEAIETRGTAEVREVFHLSRKAGVVAGSHVTEGIIDRKHVAKVIRDGVVVREGAQLASLRRYKDDVKEVRAGFDCGIRLEGFDDVHVGDLIETYEIVKTARTL
ncbi:MAG: translation initiation factor IF-2 [Phycisphaerae bacterium]